MMARARRPRLTEARCRSTAAVAQAARARGLILLTCGTYGNVIRLLPPVTMPDEPFVEGMGILSRHSRPVLTPHHFSRGRTGLATSSTRPVQERVRSMPSPRTPRRRSDTARRGDPVLGFDEGRAACSKPRKEVTVSIPLRRDDGTMDLYIGHRVSTTSRGPAKGGIRYSQRGPDEVRALAMWMTEVRSSQPALRRREGRCPGRSTGPRRNENERLTRRYTSGADPLIGPDRTSPLPIWDR